MRWVFTLDEDFHIYGDSSVLMARYIPFYHIYIYIVMPVEIDIFPSSDDLSMRGTFTFQIYKERNSKGVVIHDLKPQCGQVWLDLASLGLVKK